MEPDFAVQNGEPMTGKERQKWFQACAAEMKEQGATWLQMTVDDADKPRLTLIEGWRQRPTEQPAPHFFMVVV